MKNNLTEFVKILNDAKKELTQTEDKKNLEKIQIKYLGRKSKLTQLLRSIKNIEQSKRKEFGQKANQTRKELEHLISEKREFISNLELEQMTKNEYIDVNELVHIKQSGHLHILSQYFKKATDIFQKMGFEVIEPRLLDDDYNHFKALNIPEGHPARDIWDTIWTEDGYIAIAHTSTMQNRILRTRQMPIKAIVPGPCFRNEATDARHEHSLIQIEGVYVDKNINISDMIGTLKTFFTNFFEKEVQVKVTNDYFPFVEPGNGMELSCVLCDMKGCRVCKYSGWLEILGCGMIHPNVLTEAGIDSTVYSGFAWGVGLDRLVMLTGRNIDDVRLFRTGDLRFIRQF